MGSLATSVHLIAVGLLGLASATVSAQTMYRCSSEGRTYLSDRPCGGATSTGTGLGVIGPVREARQTGSSSMTSPANKAPEHLQYQSPLCSELSEGIRNGPGRGLGRAAQSELRESYRERCSEDEYRARRRLGEERGRKRQARDNEELAARAEQAREKLSREQCDEMYRIIHGKRQRVAAMTPGERGDFERFEANWKARCRV